MSFLKNKSGFEKILKIIFFICMILGVTTTLIYIFYTSTAILTSDSVITEVLSHQQFLDKEFILTHWYYGNEFWLFSLTLLTLPLSFIIKNQILARQIGVLITAIIFFVLLYKYGKRFLGKWDTIVLIAIFLTGISYSLLDYFYAFNAYLTVLINSMFLLYLYFIGIVSKNNKKRYFVLALIFTFLYNLGSLRYFPSVTFAFILTEVICIIINNKNCNIKQTVKKEKKLLIKLFLVIFASMLSLSCFSVMQNKFHYEQRAGRTDMTVLSGESVSDGIKAVVECVNNFFGYDNLNNAVTFMTGTQYFVNNHREKPLISFFTFTNIIKVIMCIIFMIITPIALYKNYKKNDDNINFLLIFNTVSWALMIYMYLFTPGFFYNNSELKYFIFNITISIILGIYFIFKYIYNTKTKKYIVDIVLILYIISNLYTTILTIKDNDKQVMKEKFQLVNLLRENNLTYGYGGFWNSLLTHFLSNYEITVASITYYNNIIPYKWYSDDRWYSQKYSGRIFIILDKSDQKMFRTYEKDYPKPDKILKCKGFLVYVYNKNPFLARIV